MKKNDKNKIYQAQTVSLMFEVGRLLRANSTAVSCGGFSFFRIKVLDFVANQAKPTMKDVADNFGISCPSATAVIERLVELKYLRRAKDSKDRRLIRLELTTKGKNILTKGIKDLSKRIKSMLVGLNKEEKEELRIILNKIVNIKTTT